MKCVRRCGFVTVAVLFLTWAGASFAQDLEPRRWSHLPMGANFFGAGLIQTDADIFVDPVLRIEDGEAVFHTAVASYLRSFELLGKSARVDLRVPYQSARWSGVLDGERRTVRRHGVADPRVRLSVNLLGAPALRGKAFQAYRATRPVDTIVGAALAVSLPLGEYQKDKLLNLGQNRFIVRPQMGAVHTRGPWAYELTGSVFLFSDNDEFRDVNRHEQDPLYFVQGHIIHTFRPGLWASLSAGYGWDGESRINGVPKDDSKQDVLTAISIGLPIDRTSGIKLVYVRSRTDEEVGSNSDSIAVGYSKMF